MLLYVKIRDFALIRELEIEFQNGFNLLTGETGSGKSILVDALSLLAGKRSSQDLVRSGCESAVLEGAFALDAAGEIAQLLTRSGIPVDENTLLVRREISAGGRSRVYINNNLATLSFLKSIGENLIDIHGQRDHQMLLDLSTHLEWLDRFGGNIEGACEVREAFIKLRDLARQLDAMEMDEQERLRRMDILQFQIKEIRQADVHPQEREELENEKKILANREKIFALATEAHRLLYEGEPSILSETMRLKQLLQELEAFDTRWIPHHECLRDTIYKLEDVAYAVRDYTAEIDFSPERIEQVEQRLAELDRLGRKYGATLNAVLAYAAKCEREMEDLISHEDASKQLAARFEEASSQYLARSQTLSEKRRKDAARLQREIRKEFRALSMEKMELGVRFYTDNDEDGSKRIPGFYGPSGLDHVEFLVAPNRGEEARPLVKIASGGELSRVMLSMKSLCGAGDEDKTLVFDEIDAGIGGRAAEAVGRRLRNIAEKTQVLCVTHLPQIASFAHHHFSVWKESLASRTETFVKHLSDEERVEELARMLGGKIITETTRSHAREMLATSQTVRG